MKNIYIVSSVSYSDYGICFLLESPNVITGEQFKKYYIESIKRSAEFYDMQLEKLRKHLDNKEITSTNYFSVFPVLTQKQEKPELSFKEWNQLCKDAGVEDNPNDWLEKILTENGCKVLDYEEFNTDEWN